MLGKPQKESFLLDSLLAPPPLSPGARAFFQLVSPARGSRTTERIVERSSDAATADVTISAPTSSETADLIAEMEERVKRAHESHRSASAAASAAAARSPPPRANDGETARGVGTRRARGLKLLNLAAARGGETAAAASSDSDDAAGLSPPSAARRRPAPAPEPGRAPEARVNPNANANANANANVFRHLVEFDGNETSFGGGGGGDDDELARVFDDDETGGKLKNVKDFGSLMDYCFD